MRRSTRVLGPLILTSALVASAALAAPAPARSAPQVIITATPLGVPAVPAATVGGNLRWLDDADGAWDPVHHRIRRTVAAISHRIGIRTIRYAGGTVANLFDYRHALARPGCQTSGGYAAPRFAPIGRARDGYTIGKQAAFARHAGSATNLMLPMVNTTPARARAFVAAVAKATGQQHLTVEVGNEPMLSDQRYWRAGPLDTRLEQYIHGGSRAQRGSSGDRRLFAATGCDLLHAARANGRADQVYRPRYVPMSSDTPPRIEVGSDTWHYVSDLATAGPHARVFTLNRARTRVLFGDGRHGARPTGAMSIDYVAGPMPGFTDFYAALKDIPGVRVDVCSSWATADFVAAMDQLASPYDCLGLHQYAVASPGSTAQQTFKHYVAAAVASNQRLAGLTSALQGASDAATTDRYLAVTEYGGILAPHQHDGRKFYLDVVRALQMTTQVATGVRLADLSNFNTLFERYADRYAASGTGYLASLERRLVGQTPVAVSGLPSGVTAVATRSGTRTSLLAVNRTWSHDIPADLTVDPAAGQQGSSTCVVARVLRSAPGVVTRGATARSLPRSAQPVVRRSWTPGAHPWTFPSHSITLLTFRPPVDGACPGASWL